MLAVTKKAMKAIKVCMYFGNYCMPLYTKRISVLVLQTRCHDSGEVYIKG